MEKYHMLLELKRMRKGFMKPCSTSVLEFKKADLEKINKPSEQEAIEEIIKIHLCGRADRNAKTLLKYNRVQFL